MLVLGGQDVTGSDLISFEVYDDKAKSWRAIPEWEMAQGRYRLFQIFKRMTSILIQSCLVITGPKGAMEPVDQNF